MIRILTALAAAMLLSGCGLDTATENAATTSVAQAESVVQAEPASAGTAAQEVMPPDAAPPNAVAGAGEQTRIAVLAGDWRVTGVRVAPGPVQAVEENDPTLMGAVLSISPERMAWKPHEGGSFTDTCPGPQLAPDNSIGCAEGEFGPPDAHLVEGNGRLTLDWYDGAILTLSRG